MIKSAEKRVLAKYPEAFVYDDGEVVRIAIRQKPVEVKCENCGNCYFTNKYLPYIYIGSGGSEVYAWKNAASRLKSTKKTPKKKVAKKLSKHLFYMHQ